MRLLLALVIFMMLWPTIIFADDRHDPLAQKFERPTTLNLNLLSRYPPITSEGYSIDWTFGQADERGHPQYEFRGIWRYATKELKSRFSRAYRRQLLEFWNESNDLQFSWSDYQRELQEFETGDRGWWDRPWTDSLPEDKGGAPNYRTIIFGREGDWIKLGPIILTHDLKVRLKGTSLYFDGDQPIRNLKDRYIQDSAESDPKAVNLHAEDEASWLDSDLWKVRVKPSANFNLSGSELVDFIRSVSVKFDIDLFLRNGRQFGNLECGVQYDVEDQNLEFVAFFQFTEW